MIYKHELGFAAFTWPNRCLLDLSLLFIVLVGRNFVSGICKLKLKTPKINFKNLFFVSKTRIFPALNDSGSWFPQGGLPSLSSAPAVTPVLPSNPSPLNDALSGVEQGGADRAVPGGADRPRGRDGSGVSDGRVH